MSIDLNSLSAKQLDALISQAKKRKATLGKRKPVATVRQKLTALARAEGYSIAELFGSAGVATPKASKTPGPRKGNKLGKVAPKYRNPANPAQTWSGRGKRPHWFNDALKAGKKEKDLAI